jgi:outer membrane scaffolding protein for murein synthesis (MipA/OmpV family)
MLDSKFQAFDDVHAAGEKDMMASHLSYTAWPLQTRFTIILLLLVVWWWVNPFALMAAAESISKPLWEIGLTPGGGWVPDYPAADEYHAVGLVLPYAIYRGRIFRAGDEGIARGRFFRSSRFEFDIGLGASLPSDSDQNSARRGMPDLDTLLEAGPRLNVRLADPTDTSKLSLRFAVRPVISVDLSHLGYRGIVFNPQLVYTNTDLFNTKMRFVARLGPVFATDQFMDYFYEVESRFATPNRPVYGAKGGYLGTRLTFSAVLPLRRRLSLFGALQVGYYGGATNEDSPLFRDEVNVGVGLGLIWSVFQSKKLSANE